MCHATVDGHVSLFWDLSLRRTWTQPPLSTISKASCLSCIRCLVCCCCMLQGWNKVNLKCKASRRCCYETIYAYRSACRCSHRHARMCGCMHTAPCQRLLPQLQGPLLVLFALVSPAACTRHAEAFHAFLYLHSVLVMQSFTQHISERVEFVGWWDRMLRFRQHVGLMAQGQQRALDSAGRVMALKTPSPDLVVSFSWFALQTILQMSVDTWLRTTALKWQLDGHGILVCLCQSGYKRPGIISRSACLCPCSKRDSMAYAWHCPPNPTEVTLQRANLHMLAPMWT